MAQSIPRWLKFAALLLVPLLLYAVLTARASWRPRTFHYQDLAVAVAYSSDGRWLACLSESQLEVRDAYTERVVWSKDLTYGAKWDGARTLAFSPDSQTLAVGCDLTVRLWNVTTHQLTHTLPSPYDYKSKVLKLLFTPDSAHLIIGGDIAPLLIRNARNGKLLRTINNQDAVFRVWALSPNGHTLATITLGYSVTSCISEPMNATGYAQYASLRDLNTEREQLALHPPGCAFVHCMAFAPDGKKLVVGTEDGNIIFWDIASRQQILYPVMTNACIECVTFSPNNQFLAIDSSEDATNIHTISLWDAHRSILLRTLTHQKDTGDELMDNLAFAPDSATLAVACGNTIQLWRIK